MQTKKRMTGGNAGFGFKLSWEGWPYGVYNGRSHIAHMQGHTGSTFNPPLFMDRINAWFFHVARFEAGLSISISSIKAPLSSIAVPHYVYLTLQGCWRQFNKKVIVGPTCEISLHIFRATIGIRAGQSPCGWNKELENGAYS